MQHTASILKTAKRLTLNTLQASGVYQLVNHSSWRRRRLLILCYHGISIEDEHEWRPNLFMPRPDFERRMEMLQRGRYNVLPLGEAVSRLYSGTLPERSVAITFDDGNYDFYAQAFPLLREHGYRATVYLHSFYCVNQVPVFRLILSYLLWKERGRVLSTQALTGSELVLDLRTAAGRNRAQSALMKFARREKFSPAEKDQLAASLAEALGIDYAALRARRILQVMGPDEVAEVSAAGMDIQLHRHSHNSPREEARYRKQISTNREVIESIVGQRPVNFCYPSGNHQEEFLPWLALERVQSATTCRTGIADRSSNPLLLPRVVDYSGLSALEFDGWLTVAAALLPHRTYVSRDA
jgi:peptidoglycan/xylan/chitin deacetylase (PgdA/CDA1 family)